jgi:hypothetical protein
MQGHSSAGAFIDRLSVGIIATAAARRQKTGAGSGERAPAGLGRGAVDLVSIEERITTRDGVVVFATEAGKRTAVHKVPPVLAKLSRLDGRRLAALAYAAAVEGVGAVRGSDLSGNVSRASSGSVPDGGAAVRVQYAATVRAVRGVVNGWAWLRAREGFVAGAERLVLAPSNKRGDRVAVRAMALVDAVCLEGRDMSYILEAHGWTAHSRDTARLNAAMLEALGEMSDLLGFGNRVAPGGFGRSAR